MEKPLSPVPTVGAPLNAARRRLLLVAVLSALGGAGAMRWSLGRTQPGGPPASPAPPASSGERTRAAREQASPAEPAATVSLPTSRWEASGVEVAPVSSAPFVETIRLTGRVSLNEDRIAHIYPMVEGAVDEVRVGLGQVVQANDLLVVVHSREIGEAKLDLYQARLQHEMAVAKDKIQQEIAVNTRELLDALRDGESITAIEERFRSRSMGDYRERLLLAYSSYLKSQADVDRLEGPADSGVISAKQLYAARANRNADQATFQARLEQIEYELRTSLLLSSQSLREAVTHVAVSSTNLRILGCGDDEIDVIDPDRQGEAISHYMVRAPFDGTVISKDVALKEQVRPDTQILRIADLSTVWITADIYEQNVPLLNSLAGQQVRVRNDAWPDRDFPAEIFYTGEIMDESTRTIALRATADNRDHLLKPGMFVNVEFHAASPQPELVVPLSAIQEHGGERFVFVHLGGQDFQRRTVRLGKQNDDAAVVLAGLTEGDAVVTDGGFVLKSLMLEDLMGEE